MSSELIGLFTTQVLFSATFWYGILRMSIFIIYLELYPLPATPPAEGVVESRRERT